MPAARIPGSLALRLLPHGLVPSPFTPLPSPHPVWFYFGVVGSFLFILIQLVLFIDFAHSWNQRWLGKAEECDSRAWYAGECPRVSQVSLQVGLGLVDSRGSLKLEESMGGF